MQMAITARQISRSRLLPVFTAYLTSGDRLHVSTSFADAIIAKYTAPEERELPSVSFVYPEIAPAAQTLDQLASQLITLNRIRVRMNVHNHHWMQNYALSLGDSCRLLLNRLSVQLTATPGAISAASVRELEHVWRELRETFREHSPAGKAGDGQGERPQAEISPTEAGHVSAARYDTNIFRFEPEEETVLKILTAASRGNGTRERYMSELYRRLQESGDPAQQSTSAAGVLDRAVTELFHVGKVLPAMSSWASEEARQFFWRVQRASEQERELILQAGGYPTILSLERELRVMDRQSFRRFSTALTEQILHASESSELVREREFSADRLVEQMSEEDWNVFTSELRHAGYVFRDGNLIMSGMEGAGETYLPEAAEAGALSELSGTGAYSDLFRNVELILRESAEGSSPEEAASAEGRISADEIPYWASEQARQLFWRIQRAPEQERRFFLQAGGFASMESLEKLLRTMDGVTFRRFSAQLLERLTRFSETRAQASSAAVTAETAVVRDTGEQTAAEEKRIFTETITGGHEAAGILIRMLMDYAEQTELRSENRAAGEALSEAVLDLTMIEWEQFREELHSLDIENSSFEELKAVFTVPEELASPEMTLREESGQADTARKERAVGAKDSSRQAVERTADTKLERGMRMSREKREVIRVLSELSRIPDHSIRTLRRVLTEQTVLREHSIRENSRQYFHSLSARERENWAEFIRNLTQSPEAGSIMPEQVFLRMNSFRSGMAGVPGMNGVSGMGTAPGETGPGGAEAAGAILEHLREVRIADEGTIEAGRTAEAESPVAETEAVYSAGRAPEEARRSAERQEAKRVLREARETKLLTREAREAVRILREEREAARIASEEITEPRRPGEVQEGSGERTLRTGEVWQVARIPGEAGAKGQRIPVPGYVDMPDLIPADMDVPQRQAAVSAQAAAAAASAAAQNNRTEYNDIEFETVTHRVEEHLSRETDRELKKLLSRMEKQEKEIGRIRSEQERLAGRNIPKEVFRKLEERAQMERLRGGR